MNGLNIAYAIKLEATFQQKMFPILNQIERRQFNYYNGSRDYRRVIGPPRTKTPENWRKWWHKTHFMVITSKGMCQC